MNNTALADIQPEVTDYRRDADREQQSPQRLSTSKSRQHAKRHGKSKSDPFTIAVLLACSMAIGTIGVIYVAAYAKVTFQAHQIALVNEQLADAYAQHEALVKQAAYLQSDHRIEPKAQQLKMSEAGNNPYIDVMPNSSMGGREVASAL